MQGHQNAATLDMCCLYQHKKGCLLRAVPVDHVPVDERRSDVCQVTSRRSDSHYYHVTSLFCCFAFVLHTVPLTKLVNEPMS